MRIFVIWTRGSTPRCRMATAYRLCHRSPAAEEQSTYQRLFMRPCAPSVFSGDTKKPFTKRTQRCAADVYLLKDSKACGAASDAELFDFLVVVLAIEDVPLLASFKASAALG